MLKELLEGLLNQENGFYSLLIIVVASVLTYIVVKIKNSAQSFKNRRGGKVLVMLVNSSFISLIILIWLNLFVVRKNFLLKLLGDPIIDMVLKVKFISTTWLLWLCLARFVKQLEISIRNGEIFNNIKDKNVVKLIGRVLTTVIYIIMGVIVLNALGMNISRIFTLLGGSAVVVGMGAKSIIERSLAGFFIRMNRKFEVGDRINLPDKNIMGNVVEIGITTTKVLMSDKETITIPNEIFQTTSFINCSQAECRCVTFKIDIPSKFANELQSIMQNIKTSIEKLDMVQAVNVICMEVSDYSIERGDWFLIISIRAFLNTKDFVIARNFKSLLIAKSLTIVNMIIKQKDKS